MTSKLKPGGKAKQNLQPYGDPGILLSPTRVTDPTTTQSHVFQFLPEPDQQTKEKRPHTVRFVQNMNEYHNPPEGLPIIIREKDLANRQRTMKHFLALNDFSTIPEQFKKKESHPEIQKHASIQFITNIANIASSNYAHKKNQGVMLVNELWGRKYHKSILHASGLRKDQHRIKQKSLKIASERVKAVEKYYEAKHRDEIQKEREFLELLVIPVENTESNQDLKAMLNTKKTDMHRKSRSIGLTVHNRRNSLFPSADNTQTSKPDTPQDSSQGSPQTITDTEIKDFKIALTSAAPRSRSQVVVDATARNANQSPVEGLPSVPSLFKLGSTQQQTFTTLMTENSNYKTIETEPSPLGAKSLSNTIFTRGASIPNLKPPEREQQINSPISPILSIFQKNLSFKDLDNESPLTKALRSYVHKRAASVSSPSLELFSQKSSRKPEHNRSVSKHSIRTSSPEDTVKNAKKNDSKAESFKEIDGKSRPSTTVSTKRLHVSSLARTDSKNSVRTVTLSDMGKPNTSMPKKKRNIGLQIEIPDNVPELKNRPQTVSGKSATQMKSAMEYQMHSIPESTKEFGRKNENYFPSTMRATSSGSAALFSTQSTFNSPGSGNNNAMSKGRIKAEEIDRLKNNFLNLMFYCEDVRDDQEVIGSVKETQKTVRELFKFQNKQIKGSEKKSKEELAKTIHRFFHGEK